MRGDEVLVHMRRHDESFSIVYDEGFKRFIRTLHDHFFPLQQGQHVDRIAGNVANGFRKSMSSCFDKLVPVKTGPFFFPTIALTYRLELICKLLRNIFCITIPTDDLFPALQVDGARLSIQAEPVPVP